MAPSTSKLLVFIACLAGTRHADAASAQLFQSSGTNGDRLARKADLPLVSDFEFSGPTIEISKDSTDQVIQGFGGAFTEASALVFKSLPADKQQKVLDLYFGPYGIGYTLGRVHMNSCDFSPKSYSFDDVDGDFSLAHFDNGVSHDTEVMIPLILAAQDKVREANGAELKLIAAPWSPPAWMKTNGQMDGSDKPGLQDGCQAVWASYFPKWLSAYKARGISIWAITPQNEPENPAGWEACVYDAEQELQFLGEHLGPTLRADHPDVKIFIFDHNKDHVYDWAKALYADPRAQEYAAGVAFHWYSGDSFDHVASMHTDFPQAQLLATEATFERYRWRPGSTLVTGDWAFGEGYAHDIIGDLNAGATGWIDWNLFLNQDGGPNHVDNVCDAAILANTTSGEVFVHPQYYAMGHFSKYLVPGSKRLQTSRSNTPTYTGAMRPYGTCTADDGLEATSFLRPDGQIAVVVLNCADGDVAFKLKAGSAALHATIPGHGIQTYLFSSSSSEAFV
mmetsp:Transcript_102891/g.276405  ORF Transcript_102891/g.276405 Transcript_102891/m.276405 type:complete len:507 (-) Transcript_102891:160-1680(-)